MATATTYLYASETTGFGVFCFSLASAFSLGGRQLGVSDGVAPLRHRQNGSKAQKPNSHATSTIRKPSP